MKYILTLLICVICISNTASKSPTKEHNLIFKGLSESWDEAMPLGNGMVGCLVWQKDGKLRFSLDRADLWDLRPMENIDFEKWKFEDVYEHWKAGKYKKVQNVFDVPYDELPAPSKIPAGALEFDISKLGIVKHVELDLASATCVILWQNGARLSTFVHGDKSLGWYKFENLPESIEIELVSPAYNRKGEGKYTSQAKNDLNQLGYPQGEIEKGRNSFTYNQKGWGDFSYEIFTRWEEKNNTLTGCWSISSSNKGWEPTPSADVVVAESFDDGFEKTLESHMDWWTNYWSRSSVDIPDPVLEKQYHLEMYKFGAAARADAPPIALQSVWTADHGLLPPWKGDFHHDLNTQLSYWPAYAGNYLDLEVGFLNWLWKYRTTFKKYTKDYFGVSGMNVPGVTTLEGEPMGGWIQYSMGQTVASWLSHHFYLHWKFSMDREFLENRAYPWIRDVAIYLDQMAKKSENGKRKLAMSSSPEIFNNSEKAWFEETTNFDLALIRWTYQTAEELALELGLDSEAKRWKLILSEWPGLVVDPETGFMFAPEFHYAESHRHFSHLMGFHPLGLVDYSYGDSDQKIITNTLRNLEAIGTGGWTGYSFSWLGNLYARAFEGENAARVLKIFAECFCLKNSFHVNGDQCKAGYSDMTYRPFTLEGNFAFASGIQEMLIQSHTGIVKLFPAIPGGWKEARFDHLRTYGAFLVSSTLKNGLVESIAIESERGGEIWLDNPFKTREFKSSKEYELTNNTLKFHMQKGEKVVISASF